MPGKSIDDVWGRLFDSAVSDMPKEILSLGEVAEEWGKRNPGKLPIFHRPIYSTQLKWNEAVLPIISDLRACRSALDAATERLKKRIERPGNSEGVLVAMNRQMDQYLTLKVGLNNVFDKVLSLSSPFVDQEQRIICGAALEMQQTEFVTKIFQDNMDKTQRIQELEDQLTLR